MAPAWLMRKVRQLWLGGPGAGPSPIAADGAGADDQPELQELTADPFGSPEGILVSHSGDQLADLRSQARSAEASARAPAPVEAPSLSVPADYRLGPDQEQVPSPVPTEAMDTHPEKLVPGSEGWPPRGAEGDLELLPEEEVFEKQVMPAAKSPRYDGEQKPDKFEHQARITDRPLGWGPTLTFAPARPHMLMKALIAGRWGIRRQGRSRARSAALEPGLEPRAQRNTAGHDVRRARTARDSARPPRQFQPSGGTVPCIGAARRDSERPFERQRRRRSHRLRRRPSCGRPPRSVPRCRAQPRGSRH